jgi:hypothetical protein
MKIQQKPLDSPSEVWDLLCNAFGVKFKPLARLSDPPDYPEEPKKPWAIALRLIS